MTEQSKSGSGVDRSTARTETHTSNPLALIPKAERASRKLRDWRMAAERATVAVVEACSHPHEAIVEGRYRPSEWLRATPSFLLCTICGYAEEGWGAGSWRIHESYDEPVIDRDEAWPKVRVFVSQDDMERLGRYGQHRADPKFSLRDCVRNVPA